VPERLSLEAAAEYLRTACLVIGLDTGLTHLAGAFGVPTIALYVATDPSATGLYACAQGRNLGGRARAPSVAEVTRAAGELLSGA
jgi:heptosyltransferase-1